MVNNIDFRNTGHGSWYISAHEYKLVNVIPKSTRFFGKVP